MDLIFENRDRNIDRLSNLWTSTIYETSFFKIANFYTNAFKKDCERLNIKWPEIVVPATNCVDDYINLIKTLLEKGYAYISGGNVYFDFTKLEDYYPLTNHQADNMVTAVRESVEEDLNKKNQLDVALWFTKSKFN